MAPKYILLICSLINIDLARHGLWYEVGISINSFDHHFQNQHIQSFVEEQIPEEYGRRH